MVAWHKGMTTTWISKMLWNFRFDYRPLKTEKYRARMVVGGDRLSNNDDPGSPAASLLETKLLLNSVIPDADKGARVLGLPYRSVKCYKHLIIPNLPPK